MGWTFRNENESQIAAVENCQRTIRRRAFAGDLLRVRILHKAR